MFKLAFLLMLLLRPFASATSFQNPVSLSGRVFVTPSNTSIQRFFLKTNATMFYDLNFLPNVKPPHNLPSGTPSIIKGYLRNQKIQVTNYTLPLQSIQEQPIPGTSNPIQITSISFITQFCGYPPVKEFELQQSFSSLASFIPACTNGLYQFASNQNIIIGPLQLPCMYNPCDYSNLYSSITALENYANTLKIPLERYKHRLMILPKKLDCRWSGLGNIGCSPYCYAWFPGNYITNYEVILHELGHNFGLEHASSPDGEYADQSCVMGYCCNKICFNAPHQWKLRIAASKVAIIPNRWQNVLLLPGEFIKVEPVDPRYTFSYFVSFRSNKKEDANLSLIYQNKVLIYTMQNDSAKSMLVANLSEKQSFILPLLYVIFQSTEQNISANIMVCSGSCS